jgi:hypothetical protein
MAFRLGEYVIYGELYNMRHYSTHGFVVLRGASEADNTLVRIELTGDCAADLKGKHFRFRPSPNSIDVAIFDAKTMRLQPQQIGPTALMTAQGWVREMPCSIEEFCHRASLGEPPPTRWVPHLYLEWYSQNGRVLIEMADPIVEECTREPENDEDDGEWAEIPNLALPPRALSDPSAAGLGISIVRPDHPITEFFISHEECQAKGASELQSFDSEIIYDSDDDDYGDDDEDALAECKLMDHCIDHCQGKSLASLLGGTDAMPRPEDLDDEKVEIQLKLLLGQLAMFQVSVSMCEHFTPRDCYKLLLDTVLHESETFVELLGSGWVTGILTHEYCPECEAQSERDYANQKEELS